jgi:hypothetical protein
VAFPYAVCLAHDDEFNPYYTYEAARLQADGNCTLKQTVHIIVVIWSNVNIQYPEFVRLVFLVVELSQEFNCQP